MVEKSSATSFWPSIYEPFRAFGTRLADWIAPASEASSDDGGYRIAVEIPGVAEKDINVTVNEGVVTVKGEKRSEREEKGDTWYFSERQFGSFCRSFRLPADADGAKLAARLKDGVLTLTAPKITPEASGKMRKVEIGRA
ncbi:MAG: Hsp20/alpha crystallin family protein [Paracoccaceae bacterium]